MIIVRVIEVRNGEEVVIQQVPVPQPEGTIGCSIRVLTEYIYESPFGERPSQN